MGGISVVPNAGLLPSTRKCFVRVTDCRTWQLGGEADLETYSQGSLEDFGEWVESYLEFANLPGPGS
jgi:hypothetical protein